MRRVILYTAASIDAMIARPDGSLRWLESRRFRIKGEDFGYAAFLRSVDTTIMGYRTYRHAVAIGDGVPYTDTTNYVITRSPRRRPDPHVRFLSRSIIPFIRRLRAGRGKHIWLVGGREINTLLLRAGLIDRLIITTIPVVLGEGIPLFGSDAKPKRFRLRKRVVFSNGFVQGTWDRA